MRENGSPDKFIFHFTFLISYSVRNDLTGLAAAALNACVLMVIHAISMVMIAAATKTHQWISIL